MITLYRNLEKLLEVNALDQWIATVAKRTTWKMIHRRRKHLHQSLTPEYDSEDPELLPEEHLQVKVQQARIRRGLNMMNDKCRKLLVLLFYKYDSADYDLIAEETGIRRGSIGPMRQRCLARFKKILDRLGINEKNVSRWLS